MSDTERKISDVIEDLVFDVEAGLSSGEFVGGPGRYFVPVEAEIIEPEDRELSPVFRELAYPKLPELPREARARLLMQSPTRLFFYWSVGANAYASLNKALGKEIGGYQLALRLLDLTNQTEEMNYAEPEGTWWFNVQPDSEYRAEIGFYSPSRPFVRILFSNTIETPRKGPSPHSPSEARWVIAPTKFARVLEASGFHRDAIDVAVEAKDPEFLASVFARSAGITELEAATFEYDDLETALRLLAEGFLLDDLKWKISAELFAVLQERYSGRDAEEIRRGFGLILAEDESLEGESSETVALGGSLVNLRRPRFLRPRYTPVSSLNFQ